MALGYGQLAFSQIRQELTIIGYVGSYSLNAFDGMAFGGATPNYVSEFHGYSATPPESIQLFDFFYVADWNNACMESIMVGQSDLGRWFRDADLNQPLNGYYGNSSGHVAYYYNGYQGSGNGWCEYY